MHGPGKVAVNKCVFTQLKEKHDLSSKSQLDYELQYLYISIYQLSAIRQKKKEEER